jgi:osmotically-inducible protein OsmY
MSDKTLRQDVIDALNYEPSIDSPDIGIAVEDGIVTLTGHVPTYPQKVKAEEIVQRVKGVRAVAQNIEVRIATRPSTADDEVARRAADVLSWDSTLPAGIKVSVQNGWVTLSGEVNWHYQRVAAANDVKGLLGVRGVSNKIAHSG